MATLSDVTTQPESGHLHIDALLDRGPGWNWLAPARNTLYYTFALNGTNSAEAGQLNGTVSAFNTAQQGAVRTALDTISALTGIRFEATADGTAADLHFRSGDVAQAGISGLCSWQTSYSYNGSNTITTYSADAFVYLDNAEFLSNNASPLPGTFGYQILLHEIAHGLGLKHPFEGSVTLPAARDNTGYTLMSYTASGGAKSSYAPYDVAALLWLYGGDGLGGALGQGTAGRYLVGAEGADVLVGSTGNDVLQGGAGDDLLTGSLGRDLAIYQRARADYAVGPRGTSVSAGAGDEGRDTLSGVERLQFSDGSLAFDFDGAAGHTARILGAVFGRESVKNAAYAGIGLELLDGGTSPDALMQLALDVRLGAGFTPAAEVQLLYQNLTGQLPSASELSFWTGTLTSGQYTAVSLAWMAARLDLNDQNIGLVGVPGVASLLDAGLAYT